MTNEEAKLFLDNLKICIDEHPVVADWLVEIADRKTEPNNSKVSEKPTDSTRSKMEQVEDEPQSECEEYLERIRAHDPHKDWYEGGASDDSRCRSALHLLVADGL